MSETIDETKSTMRSRQGGTKRSRPSVCYSMKKDMDLISITVTEASVNKSRVSQNPNFEIEKKADLINAIKGMDEN